MSIFISILYGFVSVCITGMAIALVSTIVMAIRQTKNQ